MKDYRNFLDYLVLILAIGLFNSSCFAFGSLPLNVKKFLETADKIELIADADKKEGQLVYRGDMIKEHSLIATIEDETIMKKIVQSVNSDAGGNGDTICFLPNHILKATKDDKIVEIEICYQCMRYEIKGSLGEFSGGFNSKSSEATLNKILFEKGVEIK